VAAAVDSRIPATQEALADLVAVVQAVLVVAQPLQAERVTQVHQVKQEPHIAAAVVAVQAQRVFQAQQAEMVVLVQHQVLREHRLHAAVVAAAVLTQRLQQVQVVLVAAAQVALEIYPQQVVQEIQIQAAVAEDLVIVAQFPKMAEMADLAC
jgi:hypothetical protein